MNNLRRMEYPAKYKKKVKLSRSTMEDLKLWLSFLDSAEEGISINRVIFRKPTITTFSDACEAGFGGFCPQTGFGWRYRFTDVENKAFAPNAKEYIASAIDMDFHLEMDPDPSPFQCIFNRNDSSSTVGWLRKSNHDPKDAPIHNEVARFHATNMLRRNVCNYSQHLTGRVECCGGLPIA